MDTDDKDLSEKMKARFNELPLVVQVAIKSAEVEKHLRELADTHKLHLDQWQLLENEVMLTLLGFEEPESLQANIKNEIGVTDEIAKALADDISYTIFAPVREELERQVVHPDAKAAQVSDIDALRRQTLADDTRPPSGPPKAPVLPSTPPAPPPAGKVERAPISTSYKAAAPSKERKSIEGDPYREQIK